MKIGLLLTIALSLLMMGCVANEPYNGDHQSASIYDPYSSPYYGYYPDDFHGYDYYRGGYYHNVTCRHGVAHHHGGGRQGGTVHLTGTASHHIKAVSHH